MRKRVIAKGNLRRGDHFRVLLTETLPEEVPIVFSNDGFYNNLSNGIPSNHDASEFVARLLKRERQYTIPYRYNVLRDAFSSRGLSLIHPSAQCEVADFYKNYDTLICYYCSKSDASLRAPQKVGSIFYVKGPLSDVNRLRGTSIDTVTLETTVSNPASYFSYRSISRAHQFFNSNEYMHFEKRFAVFRSLDISKCFNSIYTHTLFWAVVDVATAKDNTSSGGFANEFDRLMQAMNYNETNGICIGPEVSRIFAEIILSEVDKRVLAYLDSRGLVHKVDYDFRRYVDDYYLFCHNTVSADRVGAAIEASLAGFNLHINEAKTVTISRPFATKKSQIVADTNDNLTWYFERVIRYQQVDDDLIAAPLYIQRSDQLIRQFLVKTKAICSLHGTGYETVSDYIISAVTKRIADLASGVDLISRPLAIAEENYVRSITLLVETVYLFYTVNPTVRASLNVARSVIIATRLFRDRFPERLPYLAENVVRWTLDLAESIKRGDRHKDLAAVPIEVLNIVIPMREIADAEPLVDTLVDAMCAEASSFQYFEIVTFLFLMGGRPRNRKNVASLFSRAKEIVKLGPGPRMDSQVAHLSLDLLACPFLPLNKRASWFNTLRSRCGLPKISSAAAQAAVSDLEHRHWFVKWDQVDLLRILRKKELSAIY